MLHSLFGKTTSWFTSLLLVGAASFLGSWMTNGGSRWVALVAIGVASLIGFFGEWVYGLYAERRTLRQYRHMRDARDARDAERRAKAWGLHPSGTIYEDRV